VKNYVIDVLQHVRSARHGVASNSDANDPISDLTIDADQAADVNQLSAVIRRALGLFIELGTGMS
jgi:hypothetical protein